MFPQAPRTETPCMEEEHGSKAPFAVLFDSDGVIVDTEGISLRSFRQATREFIGADLTEEEVEEACGLRDTDIVSRLARSYEVAIDLEAYRQRKSELYRLEAEKHPVRTFAGVAELLDHLRHERIPYALASSGPRSKIEFNLTSASLRSYFSIIVSGEEVERGKPSPDIFLEAARRIGIEPARCVVVEDSVNGIRAARAGGMATMAVTNTFGQYQLHQADRIVDTLEHIKVADFHQLVLANLPGVGPKGPGVPGGAGGVGGPGGAGGPGGPGGGPGQVPEPEIRLRRMNITSLS